MNQKDHGPDQVPNGGQISPLPEGHYDPHSTGVINEPVLEGSHMSAEEEARVKNPNRGDTQPTAWDHQPALQTAKSSRWLFSGLIAALIWIIVHGFLLRWDPVLAIISIGFVVVVFAAMVVILWLHTGRRRKLHVDAALLSAIWLVPLVLAIVIFLRNDISL